MKQSILIFVFVCIIVMPFSSYADEQGTIGSNMGLDFYSRIDDAGDSLAQKVVVRRLSEKGTYKSLGCGATWLDSERIDQKLLDELVNAQYSQLLSLAGLKKITLTTNEISRLSQCLVDAYMQIQRSASQYQNTLEKIGNVGLYFDGDIANSDYDIIDDITRINAIIFKEKYDYGGTKNATALAIDNLLAGNAISSVFSNPTTGTAIIGTPASATAWSACSGGIQSRACTEQTGGNPVTCESLGLMAGNNTQLCGTLENPGSPTISSVPWAGTCIGGTMVPDTGVTSLFGSGFFDGIDTILGGGAVTDNGHTYTSGGIVSDGSDTGLNDSIFGNSEESDFFHTPPCSDIFCITIDMVGGTQDALGGFSNTSIESLLEKHSTMMEPISWSDLSYKIMTRNSYQDMGQQNNFASMIAFSIYMTESPQQTTRLETEDTQEKKDAIFDAAFRCAMNEAGLPGDPILANGFGGAGFVGLSDTTHVPGRTLPVSPHEMDKLAGCYNIRMGKGKEEAYKSFSKDLNEIQGFTDAMMKIILEILETDSCLDRLPVDPKGNNLPSCTSL